MLSDNAFLNGCNLEELWFDSNPIGNNGIRSLCKLIISSNNNINISNIKVIKLQCNKIDIHTKVCNELILSLQTNYNILKFSFDFRHIHDKDRLQKILWRNHKNSKKFNKK